jgi:hypothetical protein
MAVVVLSALVVVRLITRDPGGSSGHQHKSPQAPPDVSSRNDDRVVSTPLSPAGVEVLARIRSCSERDLEGIANTMSDVEAYGIFHQLTDVDRQAVILALPVPILARKAHELLGVPESVFRSAPQPALLASSLIDAALGVGHGVTKARPKPLIFATGLDGQDAPLSPRGTFRSGERRIYACLDAGSEPIGEPGVLVRWSEEGSGTLVYLHYQPLSPNHRWSYVYFEVTGAWTPGTYRVGFHRIGTSASLLAEGTYFVAQGD